VRAVRRKPRMVLEKPVVVWKILVVLFAKPVAVYENMVVVFRKPVAVFQKMRQEVV
jgi:hypothetical protein